MSELFRNLPSLAYQYSCWLITVMMFLFDLPYLLHVLQIRKDQGRIEKWVMRKAFDDEENPYLPKVCMLPLIIILAISKQKLIWLVKNECNPR